MVAKSKPTTHREIGQLVEKQMRNWEIERSQRPIGQTQSAPTQLVEHFVSLSRSAGLPGFEIAQRLGERLGWPIFDREILHEMADSDAYRERIYRHLDRHDESWLNQFVRAMTYDRYIGAEDYCRRLMETVIALARKGHAIFLGRATDLFLPKDVGLRVRLIADHAFCVRSFATQKKLSQKESERQITVIERERAKFLRNHFQADSVSPTRHDLLINMERFDIGQTVEIILAAMRLRGIVK